MYTRSRCVLFDNNGNMYIIVREVTNYTNEQLLLFQLLGRRVAPPQFSCSLATSHRFPFDLIVLLESWAFSLRV